MADIAALQNQLRILKERETNYKEHSQQQRTEIAALRAALRALTKPQVLLEPVANENEMKDDIGPHVVQGSVDGSDKEDSHTQSDEDSQTQSEMPLALWDSSDKVLRCSICAWEVIQGICQQCGTERRCTTDNNVENYWTDCTDNEAYAYDRLPPRGDTPLGELPADRLVPAAYENHPNIYRNLLLRGATRLMCETFQLEYSSQDGIIAWADSTLFETFSGPAMLKGQAWKIHLGRRIVLDEEDLDGSEFVDGLLEDVLFYPVHSGPKGINIEWETVAESRDVWVTRPKPIQHCDDITSDSDYESDDDEDAMYAEDGSGIPANFHGLPECYRYEDAALEHPNLIWNDPVVQADQYETSSDLLDSSEDDEEDEGWATRANVPDAVFPGSDEEEDELMDCESDVAEEKEEDKPSLALNRELNRQEDDIAGSDWDSDEALSGDEEILR